MYLGIKYQKNIIDSEFRYILERFIEITIKFNKSILDNITNYTVQKMSTRVYY